MPPLNTATERANVIVSRLLSVYVAYILLFAWTPFTVSIGSLASVNVGKFKGWSELVHATPWDIWTNVVFFLPFGFLFVLLPNMTVKRWPARLLGTALVSALLSYVIEAVQLLLPRAPALVDIVYNTLGGTLGAALGSAGQTFGVNGHHGRPKWFISTRTWGILFVVYALLAGASIASPLPLTFGFVNWDPNCPIVVGNEATLDRPWQGTIYLLAVYEYAFTADEVAANFAAGPFRTRQAGGARQGLLLYYDFSEQKGDVVHDRTESGPPLDLQMREPSQVEWVAPRGVVLRGPTVLTSLGDTSRVASPRFAADPQLTVEAWMAPSDLSQSGPARLISYSYDPHARNFTIGQDGRNVVFRLRTLATGLNGTNPHLTTSDSPLTSGVHHIVATYTAGVETLHVDGVTRAHIAVRSHESLSDVFGTWVGRPRRWLVESVIIFPLGILAGIVCYRVAPQSWRSFVSFLSVPLAMAVLAVILALRWRNLGAPVISPATIINSATLLASGFVVSAWSDRR